MKGKAELALRLHFYYFQFSFLMCAMYSALGAVCVRGYGLVLRMWMEARARIQTASVRCECVCVTAVGCVWRRVHALLPMTFVWRLYPCRGRLSIRARLNSVFNMRESESNAADVVTHSSVTNGFRFSQGKLICAAGALVPLPLPLPLTPTHFVNVKSFEIAYTRCVVFVRIAFIYASNSLHHCSAHEIQHESGSQISRRDFTSRHEI